MAIGVGAMFKYAFYVAVLARGGWWAKHNVSMPDWWWQARLPPDVIALDASDTAMLKKVLFSGEPWLLQCYSGLPFKGQHLPKPFRLHPSFTEALGGLKSILKAGTLDCEKVLPSNKTLVSKFGLIRRSQPLLLFAGGGDKPKQVPAAATGSAYALGAWVKPKAEPRVRLARSQKALDAYCGGRRACLIARMDGGSPVLEQLAQKFRTLEVVAVGEAGTLAWGRGEEVGETLEPEEAKHFGRAVSLLRADPDAPRARKGARPAPRLLRGFGGAEDLPSIARFVENALAEPADGGGFVSAELPKLTAGKVPAKPKTDNSASDAARQRKRAASRTARAAKDAAERAEREAERARREASAAPETEEQRRAREARRREAMAAEEESAANIVEEADDDDDDDADADDEADIEEENEDDGSDVLDLDA